MDIYPNGDVVPISIETPGKFGEIGYKYICKVAESCSKGFKRSTVKKLKKLNFMSPQKKRYYREN